AAFGGAVPRRLTFQIRLPEWPGAALKRPHRVDTAHACRLYDFLPAADIWLLLAEEDAVVQTRGRAHLLEAELAVNLAAVLLNHLAHGQLQEFGQPRQLDIRNPHVPRPAGAAVAALVAGELEAVGVPG